MGGAIFFEEFHCLETKQVIMIPVGIALCLAGVVIISTRNGASGDRENLVDRKRKLSAENLVTDDAFPGTSTSTAILNVLPVIPGYLGTWVRLRTHVHFWHCVRVHSPGAGRRQCWWTPGLLLCSTVGVNSTQVAKCT